MNFFDLGKRILDHFPFLDHFASSLYNCFAFNKIKIDKSTSIKLSTSFLKRCIINVQGKNNTIIIGKHCYLDHLHISIYGNNNRIFIGNRVCMHNTDLYIEDDNGDKSKVLSVDFRPKKYGWGRYHILVKFKNKRKYSRYYFGDTYFTCFLNHASIRSVCDDCPYYHYHRSDITIADFWGYKSAGVKKHNQGMSMIICNTAKGASIFSQLNCFFKKELALKYTDYARIKENGTTSNLQTRNHFFETALNKGYENAANEMYDTNEYRYIINSILRILNTHLIKRFFSLFL